MAESMFWESDDRKIWVVVTTYNEEDTVKEVLESVLGQTRKPDRVLVVDDGSTDGTLGVLDAYRDRVLVVLKDHPHRGVMDSIEIGSRLAKGNADMVVVVSAHVTVPPGWIEGAVAEAEKNAKAGLIHGPLEMGFNINRSTLTRWQKRQNAKGRLHPPPWAHFQERVGGGGAPPQPSLLAFTRRALEVLDRTGGMHPEAYSEELVEVVLKREGLETVYSNALGAGKHTVTRFRRPIDGLKYVYSMSYFLPVHIAAAESVGISEADARARRRLSYGLFHAWTSYRVATLLLVLLVFQGGWSSILAAAALVLHADHQARTRGPIYYSGVYFWYFILADFSALAGGLAGSLKSRRLAI